MWRIIDNLYDGLFTRLLPKLLLIFFVIVIVAFFSFPVTPQFVDNLFYLNSARNIYENFSYMSGLGEFQSSWPIFYSGLLSIFSFFGENLSFIARVLNLLFVFLCSYLIFRNKFIKNKKLVVIFFLSNFFLFESSMMEMTDILFTLQTLIFLYFSTSDHSKSYLDVFLVSLCATMTKISAFIYPVSFIGLITLDLVWGKRNISRKNIFFFLSSFSGVSLAVLINSYIQNYHINDLGIVLNKSWSSSTFEWILIELKKPFDIKSFSKKFNLFTSFIFPFRIFSDYSIYFVLIGLFIFFKIFKNVFLKLGRGEYCINLAFCIAYGLMMTVIVKNTATRHLLILTPFLLSIFFETTLKYKVTKLVLIISFFLNISLSSYFILFGNKKTHFGLVNYYQKSIFYKSKYQALKIIINRNRELLNSSNVYTKSHHGRFISLLLKKNITYSYEGINEIKTKINSVLIAPEKNINNDGRKALGEIIDSESGISIYKIRQ